VSSPVLELSAVSKTYDSVTAVRDVSFGVEPAELLAIVGPSGSGKSTLLHVMGTLEQPSSGELRIAGVEVAGLDDRELAALRARSIGFVFQQFFLAEHQSVLGNVADGLLYAGIRRAERRTVELDVRSELLTYLNRASDAVYAIARYTDEPDPQLFGGRS